jgi:hypothetical protein
MQPGQDVVGRVGASLSLIPHYQVVEELGRRIQD